MSARKIVLLLAPEASVVSFVGPLEETHGDGLLFGGRDFSCLVLLLRQFESFCPDTVSDGVKIGAFGANGCAIVLQDLYEGLVVLQVLV